MNVEGDVPTGAILRILSIAEVEGKAEWASIVVTVRRVCRPVRTLWIAIPNGKVIRPVGADVVVARRRG